MGAETVGFVFVNVAFGEEEGTGVAGADMSDEGEFFLHGVDFMKTAQGFEVDEAGHFAIVENLDGQSGGDCESVGEGFFVIGFREDVGDDDSGDFFWPSAKFA